MRAAAAPYQQFRLPDVGEGLTEAEILQWFVAVGDTVVVNQVLVEVETAKAAVELPSPYAGVVTELHVAAGETVDVGTPIITIDTEPDAGRRRRSPPRANGRPRRPPEPPESLAAVRRVDEPAEPAASAAAPPAGRRQSGAGPSARPCSSGTASREASVHRRPTTSPRGGSGGRSSPPATAASSGPRGRGGRRPRAEHPRAKPPVRKLAKDLGVDLAPVSPRPGLTGTVTRDDVQARAASAAPAGPAAPATTCGRTVVEVQPGWRRRRAPRAGQGRAQAHGRGDGPLGVHDPARHRVGGGRRRPVR